MHAVRNIKLCTKDCLCLYVCPTGATDTENGQIDAEKCLDGCRVCVDACASNAISLVPETYPAQQEKTDKVKQALLELASSKVQQEKIALDIERSSDDPELMRLAKALRISNRIMAEDILRESGYMLPQSQHVQDLLESILKSNESEGLPVECIEKLISELKKNNINTVEEKNMSGNKTLENLMEAFAGESQANRKYLAYAKKAEKDGNLNAAKLFKAASDAETLHALKHFGVAKKVGNTVDNLKDAVAGETHEYKDMYPDFIKIAQEEGDTPAVMSFTFAMKAEEVHAKLYQEALENLEGKDEVFYYLCPVCGNIEKSVPEKCRICGVPGEKFSKY